MLGRGAPARVGGAGYGMNLSKGPSRYLPANGLYMTRTLLIAAPEHHAGLLEQRELKGALAVDSADAARALDVVKREKPDGIAIERAFLQSPHGIALMNRIRTDVSLASCTMRVVDTRRAPRVRLARAIDVLVDAEPVKLMDVSLVGAQVVSPYVLKPNQLVRLSLPRSEHCRLSGKVAWSWFEIPADGPRYRAGVEFVRPRQEAVDEFLRVTTTD